MSQPRVLIVEDEIKIQEYLAKTLTNAQFAVSACATLEELKEKISSLENLYDVIVLDRLLQGKDSAQLVEKIKREAPETRIIILSAIATAAEKASLLDLGADDYLAKPFDGDELIARVRVVLRRNKKHISLGNLLLSFENRSVKVGERECALTNKEFNLLKTLILRPGKIFHKAYLYENVWEMSSDVESNVVEATANKLRHRLKDLGANLQIKNLRNVGYWIEE